MLTGDDDRKCCGWWTWRTLLVSDGDRRVEEVAGGGGAGGVEMRRMARTDATGGRQSEKQGEAEMEGAANKRRDSMCKYGVKVRAALMVSAGEGRGG